jgi:hypothetical protein
MCISGIEACGCEYKALQISEWMGMVTYRSRKSVEYCNHTHSFESHAQTKFS